MARILIFDSKATKDSNNVALQADVERGAISASAAAPNLSRPFRLTSIYGEERVVGVELVVDGPADVTATEFDISWFMMYYNDKVGGDGRPDKQPALSDILIPRSADQAMHWMREVTEEVGSDGAVTHNFVTRTITMGDAYKRRAYFPLAVHALWGAVALYATTTQPTLERIYVYAHVGGHGAEEKYFEENQVPYNYETLQPE